MGDKDDYLTSYRVFFENFAATVNPEDQLPVQIAGYTITEAELPGEVIYWTTQYLTEKQCPVTLMTPLRRIILEEVREASKKQPTEFGYVADESVYIALRMMQAVTARVNDVCLRYLDNSRLDSLPPPPPPALREYRTVSAATKNSRRVMEDRHVEIGNLEALFGIDTTEPTCFYAVYDGHAGSAAATYCAAHLHQYLVESPRFSSDLEGAMHDAFLRTDAEFVRKSNQERVYGGSTAVVVCVRGRRLLAAWAGDSQALLAKRMRLMQLVNPHKPDREDERERIISSGGTVIRWGTWRVNGQLAVSRAIGDAQYKPYVTARPEMGVVDLDGDEDFVVVACDGLWDVVSEDAVALSVYQQLAADPDDLKAVAKRLVVQAKRVGSADNISVIVVFLKNPRDIVADNCPPMDLGLDNAAVSAPPFAVDVEPRKPSAAEAAACDADNGVSDSDSEDLGPETAVDIDADVDADRDDVDDHGMDQAAAPTPPAHAVEEGHVDGNLVDNVAESGEDSEDEWNYYKGEGDREQNASEEADEPPRSETPCQDNSAWESSSVDMNSSPLNPEAPVFVPGTVAGSDTLLAESPRKPLPMDDIELPDVAQFNTEAIVRPAELLDLDNCDHLNGHHNISMEGVTEHLNGNEKCDMESLGFGFNVGVDSDKIKDTELIQDFERIQKDTTDFCNIQVLQTHNAYNPFAAEGDEELFERLKNKERDPMSMSFYQEKDDDTCERFGKSEPHVDLNAVQPLPDSDDEDMQTNGVCDNANENDDDKENVSPELDNLLETESTQEVQEPNNDIMMFDDRSASNAKNVNSFMDFNINNANNVQSFSNDEFECSNVTHENVAPTDTPESHKLLFEQIPEIPDGKSSELGFTNEDLQDTCESEKDTRVLTPQEDMPQEIDMENKLDESPSEEIQPELNVISHEQVEVPEKSEHIFDSVHKDLHNENEIISEYASTDVHETISHEQNALSPEPEPAAVAEPTNKFSSNQFQANVVVDVHQNSEQFEDKTHNDEDDIILRSDTAVDTPEIKLETEIISSEAPDVATSKSPLPADASLPQSPLPSTTQSPLPEQSRSPLPVEPASALRPETASPRSSPMPEEATEAFEETTTPAPAEIEQLHVEKAPSSATLEAPQAAPEAAEPTEVSQETPPAADIVAPAPDIVPDRLRTELVTDIDIGIPESRAQEICVPVTNEIQHDDTVQPGATPPPTPAVEPALAAAPLEPTPVADVPLAAAAAVGVAAAATAAAVGAAKAKTPTVKKSPATPTAKTDTRTPKSAPKPPAAAAARTPSSAKRPTAPATPAKTPTSATKTPTARTTPAKAPSSASRPATTPSRPSAAAPARVPAKSAAPPAKPAPRPAPAPAREAPATAKSAPAPRAAAPRPAARPAAPKPAAPPARTAAAPAATKPAPRAPVAARPPPISRSSAATKPKETKPKAPEKPVTNGDVRTAKPAPRPAAARPAPAAPAPRPAQRAPAAAPPTKSAAPKPATRAPLDKQNKDLANKRITAKAAPPRTAPIKAPLTGRTAVTKPGGKKTPEKAPAVNGLPNGDGAPLKAPPSPPAADNALLPDVIA